MMRILLFTLIMVTICLPAIAFEKRNVPIILYEGFHIPIKFVETVNLNNLKKDDKVNIAINEDTGDDDYKIFKENSKGHAFISIKEGKINIDKGELTDEYGSIHPVEIKGFHLKDFQKGNNYIIPEGYVLDAFIINKKVYHPI